MAGPAPSRSGRSEDAPSDKSARPKPVGKSPATPLPEIKLPADCAGSGEDDSPKRRGKRRKGKKSGGDSAAEPDKEFKGLPEPGDTQVSTLGDEFPEPVSRPSLSSALSGDEPATPDVKPAPPPDAGAAALGGSFIVAAILKQLRRGLDREMIDGVFDPRRKLALVEAIKSWPGGRRPAEGKGIKMLRKKMQIPKCDDRWLLVPRVFSRQSARFELPLDSRTLATMTPMQYVSGHVAVSSGRRQLYNHVFNRHREEADDDDDVLERRLPGSSVVGALREVLGQPLPAARASWFRALLGWTDGAAALDFRGWCGVAAAAERLLGPELMAAPARRLDPAHEVEAADFETLPCKLRRLPASADPRLAELLMGIRDL